MVIKRLNEVPYEDMTTYKGVKKQILIGPKDGSGEIIMRYFSLEPEGKTPYHSHGFPHVVKVEKGRGIVVDKDGRNHSLEANQVVYIQDDEIHGFVNTGTGPFDFICIVPFRGEM
jgi:quercetin dioxygenase-like cupin family protein